MIRRHSASGYDCEIKPSDNGDLVAYVDYEELRKAAIKLADEADEYQEDEGDRMNLTDAITDVYKLTGI